MTQTNCNVHPKKKIHSTTPIEPSEANEKDAIDLGYTDESGKAIPDRRKVGSTIVQRNEPDDED
jgi:hypothetical protein